MQDREDGYRPPPRRRRGGGKWSGRGGRRLRNEARRDNREQDRGGREKAHLGPRDFQELLDDGVDDEAAEAEGETDE